MPFSAPSQRQANHIAADRPGPTTAAPARPVVSSLISRPHPAPSGESHESRGEPSPASRPGTRGRPACVGGERRGLAGAAGRSLLKWAHADRPDQLRARLLAAAAELHRLRPDADLVLAMDPDGMPWGPRTPAEIVQRSLLCARAAAAYRPDVLVFACNTGSVHALPALRAELEPAIPVVGTVPAIKPAAAHSREVAIWATAATTASDYQRRLVEEFAAGARVAGVACDGLADAVHAADDAAVKSAIAAAAARTPPGCGAVVLGCTEYELVA